MKKRPALVSILVLMLLAFGLWFAGVGSGKPATYGFLRDARLVQRIRFPAKYGGGTRELYVLKADFDRYADQARDEVMRRGSSFAPRRHGEEWRLIDGRVEITIINGAAHTYHTGEGVLTSLPTSSRAPRRYELRNFGYGDIGGGAVSVLVDRPETNRFVWLVSALNQLTGDRF